MCIRALDYCPPVDLTYGEYLRALITADMDLMPEDALGYRVAFVEAFRHRGIFPDRVRTLSEDSLRWSRPEEDPTLDPERMEQKLQSFLQLIRVREKVDQLRYLKNRREIWEQTRSIRKKVHTAIANEVRKAKLLEKLTGLALAQNLIQAPENVRVHRDGLPVFVVQAFRQARRVRDDGRALNQAFITILQKEILEHVGELHTIRCGSTLVIDLEEMKVSYVIRKGLGDKDRLMRIIKFKEADDTASLAATYFGASDEPFAALHNAGA
jgi:hypothetical protein